MDRIALMHAFVRVVETGSLSRASRELHTTQPTVSKWMQRLETSVGARLLQRNTRGIRLTETGETYFQEARRLVAEVAALEVSVRRAGAGVSGRLSLNVPAGLGAQFLGSFALEFQALHPGLVLDLVLTDRVVDLVQDGADVAVRLGGVFNPAVVARALGALSFVLTATPDYLARHGRPAIAADLARHNFLAYGTGPLEELHTPRGVERVRVTSDLGLHDHFTLRTAVLAGRGIGRTVRWLVDEDVQSGRLEVVLPACAPPPVAVHAVYLPARPQPEKVKLLVAHLAARVKSIPGWLPAPG